MKTSIYILLYSIFFLFPTVLSAQHNTKTHLIENISCSTNQVIELPEEALQEIYTVLEVYDLIYQAMEYGDTKEIKKALLEFSNTLSKVHNTLLQELLIPTVAYIKAIEKTSTYKEIRQLYGFMTAPLFRFVTLQKNGTQQHPCSQSCSKKLFYKKDIFSKAIPPLQISSQNTLYIQELLRSYNTIHIALYSADLETINTETNVFIKHLNTINSLPLKPYIQNLQKLANSMRKEKTLNQKALLFSPLTIAIQEMIDIIRPSRPYRRSH